MLMSLMGLMRRGALLALLAAGCSPSALPGAPTAPPALPPASRTPSAEAAPAATAVPPPTSAPPPPPASASRESKVLVIGMTQAPDTLFGIESQSAAAAEVLAAVRPPCVSLHGFEYHPVCFAKLPSLADGDAFTRTVAVGAGYPGSVVLRGQLITDTSSLTGPVALEQMVVTWKLVEGLRWEDGEPLTARDFVFAAELYGHPDVKNPSRFLLDRTAKYEAPDERTLVWTSAPGYVPSEYFLQYQGPEPAHALRGVPPGEIDPGDYSYRPLAYGPFKISDSVPHESTSLVANERYWLAAEELPLVGQVIFKYLTSEDQALQLLEAGEIDAIGPLGLSAASIHRLDELERSGLVAAQYVPSLSWERLDFVLRYPDGSPTPFAAAEARRAAAHAIDRQAIIDSFAFGKAAPLRSFVPEAHWAYPPGGAGLEPYEHDPAKARALLAGLGYVPNADGILEKDGRPFVAELYVIGNNIYRLPAAEQIRRDLRAVGIDARITRVPSTMGWSTRDTPVLVADQRVDLVISTGLTDPAFLTGAYRCDQIPTEENGWRGENFARWCDPEYDRLALAAEAAPDRAASIPPLRAAQERWRNAAPTLPLYARFKIGAARAGVAGLSLDVSDGLYLWNIERWDLRTR